MKLYIVCILLGFLAGTIFTAAGFWSDKKGGAVK